MPLAELNSLKADTPNVGNGPVVPVAGTSKLSCRDDRSRLRSFAFASALRLHRSPDAGTYAAVGDEFHPKCLKPHLDVPESALVRNRRFGLDPRNGAFCDSSDFRNMVLRQVKPSSGSAKSRGS
jgi:hypothetical protein